MTARIKVPSDTQIDLEDLLPEKMKFVDKHILMCNTPRFEKGKPTDHGFSFAKGFKKLSELCTLMEWLKFDVVSFKYPQPVAMRMH
jgi:hypothetical protein